MFCSNCGQGLPLEKVQFCPSCGSKQSRAQAVPSPAPTQFVDYSSEPVARKSGHGMGTAGLILGIIGLFIGFYDYSLLQGDYDYILSEEIGLLFVISATAIALSAVGVARKSTIATWGLVLSALSLFLTFYLSSFS